MVSVLLLLLAWCAAGTACARLCLAAVRAATAVVTSAGTETAGTETARSTGAAGRERDEPRELTLYEAAFLSGGPTRVVDLTLVSMARGRRLLLAHTGWVTVVDPEPEDELERSVLAAIGPQGQSRIAPVRRAAAAADAVRGLAGRLTAAGLAVPDGDGARTTVAGAVRQVRAAAAAVVALGAVALLMPEDGGAADWLVALWFALPLLLSVSCLAIARVEAHPYTRWASPAGQRLLAAAVAAEGTDQELALVAVRGTRALGEPELRAAFTHR
ncbi:MULTISPECIES: TIGR04222 domain-containing membrane protein [unclassified Streptomyces]|uniref:TIGR04222 domain-containing membrane protein n=1 Tax=unclassified Streptomyces TaxID=2593676 RepID=UPI0004C2A173|nr:MULTISPECIES: TIGR04222 domain-containing membrane protein [unclassified Streptomyces]